MRLAEPDRLLVARLGGILRLADGLDRRRNSLVSGLTCSLSDGTFILTLASREEISVELFGGKIKGDLFEEAFRKRLLLVAESALA